MFGHTNAISSMRGMAAADYAAAISAVRARKKQPKRSTAPSAKSPAPPRVRRVTPLSRLIKRGDLNIYEHTAADEILHAYHVSIGVGGTVRDESLGLPRGVPTHDGADKEAAWRLDLCRTFRRWKSELRGRPEFGAAVGLIIEERTLRNLDSTAQARKGTSKQLLLAALRHFAALRGNTPRGVRWKIPAR